MMDVRSVGGKWMEEWWKTSSRISSATVPATWAAYFSRAGKVEIGNLEEERKSRSVLKPSSRS